MRTKLLLLSVFGFIVFLCSNFAFSQGADTPAGAVAAPITIPFNANGTTVGVANNLDSSNILPFYPPGTVPSNSGNDWFYSFCPTTTGTIYITLTYNGQAVPEIFPSLTVFYGSPFTTTANFYNNGNIPMGTYTNLDPVTNTGTIGLPLPVSAGICYYIMIDSYAYNTMGFAYNLQLTYATTTTTPTTQPGCTNMGFDNGTTTGWVGNWGHSITQGAAAAPTPVYTPVYGTLNQGHHNVTTAGLDAYTGVIQKVCPLIPANTNSLMLGDGPNANYGGAQIMQKFNVTAANALFTYYYAAVMQDAGSDHSNFEQPFFKIEALDCSGNPITCGNYLVTGGPGIPGFTQIGISGVYYKDWSPVLLDLTPYIGTCITIKFTIGDCSRGAHFAYAYLDATCGPLQIATPPTVCQYTSTSLTAPSGAASYSWVNTAAPATVLSTSNPYTFTPTITGTSTYQCTMTNVAGCNSTVTTTVTVEPTPQISVTNPPAVCSPNTVNITAASVVSITSGSGTISYYSDAACTVPIASPGAITTSGTYYIKILNGNGCFDVKPVTVVVNPSPTVNVTTADQTICIGQSVNLNSTLAPAGVNVPVTFTNTTDFNITDASGTPTVSPITVSGITPQTLGVLPIVSVTVNINHTWDEDIVLRLQCPSGAFIELTSGNGLDGNNYTGTVFVPTGAPSITTGTAPFTGSFTPEQAFSLLNACTINGTWNLLAYDLYSGDVGTVLDWSIVFNNFVPTTFAWSPTTNMTNPTTLTPTVSPTVTTTYTLTATSGAGGCTASDPITITVNPLPTATISGTTTVCQNATSPVITFTGANGVAPYTFTYNINGGANQTVSSGAGSTATVNAPTGTVGTFTYNLVSVTSAATCSQTQTGSAIVTVNPLPTATISGTTTVCQNAANPTITFTGANAIAPYTFTYNINGGANQTVSSGAGTTATVSVPTATTGTFTYNLVGVSVASGCNQTQTGSAVVTVNPLPTATISGTTTVCQNAASPVITFTGANGTAPYTFTYNINGGANQTISSGAGTTATINAPTGTPGTFTYNLVSVSVASGCSQTQTGNAVITVNPLPTATISGTTTVCQNAASPVITFTGANGTAPYTFTYNINGGANQTVSSGAGTTATVSAPTGVVGTFTYNLVSVSVASGCNQTQTGNAVVTVNPLPTATISGTTTVCQNATSPVITFTGANGTAPYTFTYNINGGANQTVSSGAGTTATVNAPTGTVGTFTYNLVSVSSSTGCNQTQTGNAVITVNPLPTATISGTTTVCQNDASPVITFTGANGTAPYTFTYNINGGANQTVSSGAGTTATVNAPTGTAGTFTYNLVSVSVTSGCNQTQTGNAVVTVNPLPTATISGTTTVCQNAVSPVITFTGANGTAPYTFTYNINGGANQTVSSGAGTTATVNAPTGTVGTFTYNLVSVSSSTGCNQTQTGNSVITVNPLPTATISGTTTVCQNNATPVITFTGAGGAAPYTFTYNINGGANQTVSSGAGTTATVNAPTGTAGTFTYNLVSVSIATGCPQTQTGSAVITVNPLPTATISGTTTVCQGLAAPTITFTGANGTAPYTITYNINGGANQTIVTDVAGVATVAASTATIGTFTYNLVSVRGANGCGQNQTGSAVITITSMPTATIAGTVTVCQNATSPVITFTGANGLPPYVFTYSINGGANQTVSSGAGTTATVNAPTGIVGTFTYSLIDVSSASGCGQTQTGNSVVTVIALPTATIAGTTTVCQNGVSPVITFTGANGTAPYTFTYNINGGTSQTVSSGAGTTATVNAPTGTAGTFTYNLVSVSSANTCSQAQTGSAIITVDPLPTATVSGATTICQNGTAPNVTFTGAGGTAPYTFTYNINGGANQTVSTTVGNSVTVPASTAVIGTFTYNLVSVSGANGCSQNQTGSAAIVVEGLPSAVIAGTTTVCQNAASPTITLTGSAGTAPYTFTYNLNGGANQTIVSNAAGVATLTASTTTAGTFTYNLVAVASNTGCAQNVTGSAVVTVNSPANGTLSGTATVCQGDPSPVVTFTGSSDAPAYTFTYNLDGGASQTLSSGAGTTATINVPTGTAGTFVYTLTNVVGANGCATVLNQSATITVSPTPTASLSPDMSWCEGGFGTIVITGTPNATVSYSVGATNSTIVLDGAGTASINTNTISTTTSFTLTLTSVQSLAGCVAPLNTSVTITINPAPNADAIADIEVCAGQAVNVPAFTSTPTGATFAWSNNNTSIGLGANGLGDIASFNGVNATQSDNTATITYIPSLGGCAGTPATFSIIVHPIPTANAGSDVSVCEDAALPFIGTTAVAGNTYQWTPPTGLSSSTAANPQVQNNTPGTTNYSVTVTSAFGCVNTDNVQVTFNALPTVSFNAAAEGCSPLTVTFTNTSANSVDCVWDIEGIGIVNSCGSFAEVFTTAGTYDVSLTITDANGCTNTLTQNDIIKVYPQAVAAFNVDAVTQSMINPEFHFTNTSLNATSYQWNFGDGTSSTATNPTHVYPFEENAYTVQLIANNEYNCPDEVHLTVNVTPDIIIYVPNTFTPDGDEHNNTFFPVLSSGFDIYNYTMYVFDRWGEIIFETHDPDFGWDGTYHGQLSMDGVYVWKIVVKEKNKDKFHEFVGHVSLLR